MRESSTKSTITASIHQSGLYGLMEASPQCKTHERLHRVCLKHMKDYQTIRNKIIWSDEMKIKLFVPTGKHGGGRLVEGKMNAEYRDILE
uniref:Uncharacterized protein n=1 Tax=Fundulus heteroclitus TaxID=8078 RepID=A0A3Q2QEW8_FUNHE